MSSIGRISQALRAYFSAVFVLFFTLGFVFIPLTFYSFGDQYRLTKFLFLKPVTFLQTEFFSQAIQNIDFSSDTIGLNILLCLLLLLALLGASHYVAFFYDSPAVHKKEKADISKTFSAGFDDNSAILPCSGIFVYDYMSIS